MQSNEQTEHSRVIRDLESLDLQVMLVVSITRISELVTHLYVLLHLVQIPLKQLAILPRHPGLDLVPATDRPGL
jgi:hypothetical protein